MLNVYALLSSAGPIRRSAPPSPIRAEKREREKGQGLRCPVLVVEARKQSADRCDLLVADHMRPLVEYALLDRAAAVAQDAPGFLGANSRDPMIVKAPGQIDRHSRKRLVRRPCQAGGA